MNDISGDIAPDVPEPVADLIQSAVRFVRASVGVELDGTQDTLPLLDHYIKEARDYAQDRPEAVPLLAQATGAYFGQLLNREFGGFWRAVEPSAEQWCIGLHTVFLAMNPVGIAYQVIGLGEIAGPPAELMLAREDKQGVLARLDAMPDVSHEEFHTFATRYDVVQAVVEHLRGEMEAGNQTDVVFDSGDYADEFPNW